LPLTLVKVWLAGLTLPPLGNAVTGIDVKSRRGVETEPQDADLPIGRLVKLNGAAQVSGHWEISCETESRVALRRQLDRLRRNFRAGVIPYD
jgi:hypothetical protein